MTLATPIMNQLKSFQMGASIFCLLYLCVFGVALIFAGFYFGKSTAECVFCSQESFIYQHG